MQTGTITLVINFDDDPTLIARFWAKVNKTDTCWLWTARTDRLGYGGAWSLGRYLKAHRVAYTLEVGPIPDGLELDHLCRNRPCVNPNHLEPVTHRENIRRACAIRAYKTHCAQGHEFTPENTKPREGGRGGRRCITCARAKERRRALTRVR